jgi:dipeptidyl aminopeptidase/acylaminoacyl peptidase
MLWQWSPLRYVKQAQTPTLFSMASRITTCTQTEEMYMALKRRGGDGPRVIRAKDMNYGTTTSVDALERTLSWFDRFLK